MRPRSHSDLIAAAVSNPETGILDSIIATLADAERAKQILRAKGYGPTFGGSISDMAARVPNANEFKE
ncbi:MAG: hypothetical protein V4724_26665 [Pseudomonadota bacterium]